MIGRSTRLTLVVAAAGLAGLVSASAAVGSGAALGSATKTYSKFVGGTPGKADSSQTPVLLSQTG